MFPCRLRPPGHSIERGPGRYYRAEYQPMVIELCNGLLVAGNGGDQAD